MLTTKTSMLALAISGLVSLAAVQAVAAEGAMATDESEKCFGVAKAGMNDCASAAHACSGHSTKSGNAKEWVKLPKGTCARLVGGRLEVAKMDTMKK